MIDGASATGNAVNGNSSNLVDNQGCDLSNNDICGLQATNNYWGSATGPGLDPADDICNKGIGTTSSVPFAVQAFNVNASIRP